MPAAETLLTTPEAFFDKHWIWGLKIGSGHYGAVYRARSRETGRAVAVKTEKHSKRSGSLRHEYEVYQRLHGKGEMLGIPYVSYYGQYADMDVMVMRYLAPSLQSRYREFGQLSLKSVCMIAIQVLSCLERVHDRGFIHRDVKPDNILTSAIDGKRIYLADFGLAQAFRNASGRHVPSRSGLHFVGTVFYASMNSHYGRQLSRRDDLESLGYTLLFLLEGFLPWDKVRGRRFHDHSSKTVDIKEQTVQSRALPRFLRKYFGRVTRLRFSERPNYASLRILFRKTLEHRNLENDGMFEWVEDSIAEGKVRRMQTMR